LAGGAGGTSPSFATESMSALALLCRSTSTYSGSDSERDSDSPSLAPGVGGNLPGIGGTWSKLSCALRPVCGLPSRVFGRLAVCGREGDLAVSVSGEVCCSRFACAKVSPRGIRGRGRGLERSDRCSVGEVLPVAAAFRRSSVALKRASRASSSDVWEVTLFFLRL
jgi:hypothetical protein